VKATDEIRPTDIVMPREHAEAFARIVADEVVKQLKPLLRKGESAIEREDNPRT